MSFFGQNNGPLRQQVEDGNEGGGTSVADEQTAGLLYTPEQEAYIERPAYGSEKADVSVLATSGQTNIPRGRRGIEKKAKPDADIQVTGDVDAVYTAGEQAALGYIQDQENAYLYGVGAAELQAGQASEAALQQWAEMNQKAFAGRMDVLQEAIPRFQEAQRQLDADIEKARQMKVNPYNYLQSVGRTGRVASVLAVGLGQLAAGAGNPNSVWQRLESSINRDISAQKANIDQEWRGIEYKRRANLDDIALLEQQLNFEDRALAVAYAAIAAQAGAAKQHAVNEITYLNTQMIEERALAKSIHAAAQARAKLTSFHLDAKVHSLYAAMKKGEKIQDLATLRSMQVNQQEGFGADTVGTAALTGGPLRNLQGAPVGPPSPTGQPAAAPAAAAVARRPSPQGVEAQEGPQQAPQAAPAVQTARGTGTPGRVDPGAISPEERPLPDAAVAQDAEGNYLDAEGNIIQPPQQAVNEIMAPEPQERAAKERAGVPNPWAGEQMPYAKTLEEAFELADAMPKPDPNDPIFQDADGNFTQATYDKAMAYYNQVQQWPEIIMEIDPGYDFEGRRDEDFSPVVVGPGNTLFRIHPNATQVLRDPKTRMQLEDQIGERINAVASLADMADDFIASGGESTLGFSITDEDGLTFNLDNPQARLALARWEAGLSKSKGLAAKSIDTGGRMSNEDLAWGQAMLGLLQKGATQVGTEQLIKLYERVTGEEGSLDSIRNATQRILGFAARDQWLNLDATLGSKIVLSPEAILETKRRADRAYQFVPKTAEEFQRGVEADRREEMDRGEDRDAEGNIRFKPASELRPEWMP